jgi:DNA-binding IclR family transcriptional regulator
MRAQNRLLEVLECLGDESPLSLSEVTLRTELPKPTVLRIMRDLEKSGWVIRPRPNSYSLGPSIVGLAKRFLSHTSLAEVAEPAMRTLRDTTGETVSLSVSRGDARMCIAESVSPQPLRYVHEVGTVGPLHRGASGRALLASMSDEAVNRILESLHEDDEDLDVSALRTDVEAIRKQGWTMSFGERYPGAVAIAVPVMDPMTHVPYSLAIFAPESRYSPPVGTEWVSQLMACATDVVSARSRGTDAQGALTG